MSVHLVGSVGAERTLCGQSDSKRKKRPATPYVLIRYKSMHDEGHARMGVPLDWCAACLQRAVSDE